MKTINWSDDGINLKAIKTSANGGTSGRMEPLKFHVMGGIQNLQLVVDGVRAFDINGNLIPDVVATVSQNF